MTEMVRKITTRDCLRWLNELDEGATIWDTDLKFISRITQILEEYNDEVQAANAAYRKWKEERDAKG